MRETAIGDATTGVLVINTNTWQVEPHWVLDINPVQIVLSGEVTFSARGTWHARTSLRDDGNRLRSTVIGTIEAR